MTFIERYNAWSKLLDCRKKDNESLIALLARINSYGDALSEILRKDAPPNVCLTSSDTSTNEDAIRKGTLWVADQMLMVTFVRGLSPKHEALKWSLLLTEDLDLPQLRIKVQSADEWERIKKREAQRKAEEEAKAKAAQAPKRWCLLHETSSHTTDNCRALKRFIADKERQKADTQKVSNRK